VQRVPKSPRHDCLGAQSPPRLPFCRKNLGVSNGKRRGRGGPGKRNPFQTKKKKKKSSREEKERVKFPITRRDHITDAKKKRWGRKKKGTGG